MKSPIALLLLLLLRGFACAEELWSDALSGMPLATNVTVLNHSNCAEVVLASFRSNATAKAFIFMPGATDELYFFRRVQVKLTNAEPSVLDAIHALTNQSPLQVTFRAPFVLLHSREDVLPVDFQVEHEATRRKLERGKSLPHLQAIDRDWSQLLRMMKKQIPAILLPYEGTTGSWHFYRHTFAGWNLTPWETLQAAALAGKSRFKVVRNGVIFEVDPRVGEIPKLDRFPGR